MSSYEIIERAKWHLHRALSMKDTAQWNEQKRQWVRENQPMRHHARCFVMLAAMVRDPAEFDRLKENYSP